VARLLRGRPISEILQIIRGIECRDGTSCPDQLALAINQAMGGQLEPADSFRLYVDPSTRHRIGLFGDIAGDPETLKCIVEHITADDTDVIYGLGNLTGQVERDEIKSLKKLLLKFNILAVLGENDWKLAALVNAPKLKDWLIQLPQVITFQLGSKKGIIFHGDYILGLPGFSDYEPFALEMNMVCVLTNFMQDSSVFPALEAMVPQFQADIILFGQNNQWGHWQVGGKDFISTGSVTDPEGISWGILEIVNEHVKLEVKHYK
jgi:predicted phosphodiesterase